MSRRLRTTAAGNTPEEAVDRARQFYERRGFKVELVNVCRRAHVKTGMIGYRVFDVDFVVRDA